MVSDELILLLLASWFLLGLLCGTFCLRPGRVQVRHVAVQSQTTYTAVRLHKKTHFDPLPEMSHGAFVVY